MALPCHCEQRRHTVGLSAEADQVQATTHKASFHSTHLQGRRGRESCVVTPTLTRRIRPHPGREPHSFPARSHTGLSIGRPHNGRPTPLFACLGRRGSEPHRSGDDPVTVRKSSKRPLFGLGETCLSVLALCVFSSVRSAWSFVWLFLLSLLWGVLLFCLLDCGVRLPVCVPSWRSGVLSSFFQGANPRTGRSSTVSRRCLFLQVSQYLRPCFTGRCGTAVVRFIYILGCMMDQFSSSSRATWDSLWLV